MEVSIDEIKEGTNVAFAQGGFIGPVLSTVLCAFDPTWRKVKPKFWHVGFIVERKTILKAMKKNPAILDFCDGDPSCMCGFCEWWICESLSNGISLTPLSKYDPAKLRFFNIIKKQPTHDKVAEYLADFVGRPYDVLVYFWNVGAELLEKIGIKLGCWNNLSFMCWENLSTFMSYIDEPIVTDYEHIMCSDFAKAWSI